MFKIADTDVWVLDDWWRIVSAFYPAASQSAAPEDSCLNQEKLSNRRVRFPSSGALRVPMGVFFSILEYNGDANICFDDGIMLK